MKIPGRNGECNDASVNITFLSDHQMKTFHDSTQRSGRESLTVSTCTPTRILSNHQHYYWSPRLAKSHYCQQLTLSVRMSLCLSVCHTPSNCFFYVSRWNRAIFGHQFSMWHSTKRCSSIFDLGPLTPKIYSTKFTKNAYKSACMADRLEMFAPTRGFSGMADSMEPCKMLWGRCLLPWQRNLG